MLMLGGQLANVTSSFRTTVRTVMYTDVADVVSSPEAKFFLCVSPPAQSNMDLSIQNETTPSKTEQDLNSARFQAL